MTEKDHQEMFEERAAIHEFDGGMPRPQAEHSAQKEFISVYGEIIRKRKESSAPMAMGKHTAANATCCQRVIEDLQAAGLCNIADWAIWMLWWRMKDWQLAKDIDQMRLEEIALLRKKIEQLEKDKDE